MEQSYRANVGAIIFDKDYNFLFVRFANQTKEKYDFVKGGMLKGEELLDTLKREIKEELGNDFRYEVIKKADWFFFYDWSKELQEKKGFRGQLRQNFWIKYISGEIKLNQDELSDYKWISKENILQELKKYGFPDREVKNFENELKTIIK